MSRRGLTTLFIFCLVLGLADLGLLNFYLAPKAWPPQPTVAVAAIAKHPPRTAVPPQPIHEPAEPEPVKPAEPEPVKPAEPEPVKPVRSVRPRLHPLDKKTIISFPTNKYHLNRTARRQLTRLAKILKKRAPRSSIIIAGHSDQRGKEGQNKTLSLRRARIVALFLMRRGIPNKSLTIQSHGSSIPLDTGTSREAWARNRRVEITVKKR